MKNELFNDKEIENRLMEHATFLNSNPEIGFDVPRTYNYIFDELTSIGIVPQCCGKGGISALIKGIGEGKTFLLRADMDALLLSDENGRRKKIHACGHYKLFGKEKISSLGKSNVIREGSEDFAYISQKIPSVAISIVAGSKSDGYEFSIILRLSSIIEL